MCYLSPFLRISFVKKEISAKLFLVHFFETSFYTNSVHKTGSNFVRLGPLAYLNAISMNKTPLYMILAVLFVSNRDIIGDQQEIRIGPRAI